jgi:hypothetical protein
MALLSVMAWTVGCAKRADFVPFLRNEIASLGGRTNELVQAYELIGKWTKSSDQLGAAIDTKDIGYDHLMNLLTRAYGEPLFYSGANERHGPTYLWPSTNVGISIFISRKGQGAEVTLTKPLE